MGAKCWMLAYVEGNAPTILAAKPELDREAAARLAQELFPGWTLQPEGDGDLGMMNPDDDELCVGCYPGLSIVAAQEVMTEASNLPARFVERGSDRTMLLCAMHSVVDAITFAIWENGDLKRSFAVSADDGILEDIGQRRPFEDRYWAGEVPGYAEGDEPDGSLPFHPLDLGEAALLDLFGFRLEGSGDPKFEPEDIRVARFRRSKKPWWKLW